MSIMKIGTPPPIPFSVDPMKDPTAGMMGVGHAQMRTVIVLEIGSGKGSRRRKSSEHWFGPTVLVEKMCRGNN